MHGWNAVHLWNSCCWNSGRMRSLWSVTVTMAIVQCHVVHSLKWWTYSGSDWKNRCFIEIKTGQLASVSQLPLQWKVNPLTAITTTRVTVPIARGCMSVGYKRLYIRHCSTSSSTMLCCFHYASLSNLLKRHAYEISVTIVQESTALQPSSSHFVVCHGRTCLCVSFDRWPKNALLHDFQDCFRICKTVPEKAGLETLRTRT